MKLSEEEKEAIEELEDFIEDDEIQNISVFTAKKIKNIIEKQQKEIEDLKEQNNQLSNYLYDSYYVSADEIREKIEEARKIKWHIPELVIEYFEELLKEK
jgi:nicotinic acid mononucleotide adenylyltransferase